MFKNPRLAPVLILIVTCAVTVVNVAEAQPVLTESVIGDGFLRSSMGITVEYVIDVSQTDPEDPTGTFLATFYSFPQHLFMGFEATSLTSLALDRRTALVTGTALVDDSRTDFVGEIEFSAVFRDRDRQPDRNDRMTLTLHLPTGVETYSGEIVPGGIELARDRN